MNDDDSESNDIMKSASDLEVYDSNESCSHSACDSDDHKVENFEKRREEHIKR